MVLLWLLNFLGTVRNARKTTEPIDKSHVSWHIFDVYNALDTVDHEILVKELEHYGVQRMGLTWVSDYLCDRKQLVSYNNNFSEQTVFRYGAP